MNVDATRTQNAQLIIGGARETVEVSAASETVTLDTTDSTIGNNFQVQFLEDLPVEDRSNPTALFYQQPGVTLDGSVTGARVDQSRVTVDGLDVNDMATGEFGAIVANAPVDSVQEFRGVTAGYLSSAAGGGGGQYELVTRVAPTRSTARWWSTTATPNPGSQRAGSTTMLCLRYRGLLSSATSSAAILVAQSSKTGCSSSSTTTDAETPFPTWWNVLFRWIRSAMATLSYFNDSGGIGTLTSAQVAMLDPLGIGFNPALFDPTTGLFNTRYPHANDLRPLAIALTPAGFRFNAPVSLQ